MTLSPKDLITLLGRQPLPDGFDSSELRDRVVLVTGAGGSIGSNLCRKLAEYPLRELILLDNDEYRLYQVHRWLPNAIPVLADYGDQRLITSLLDAYAVTDVFHVGAYKHVPLVEKNPVAAVQNNVLAAHRLFNACASSPVQSVTVVSTDKAVNPTNVMGATKALVEALVLNHPTLKERARVVRFGNVLWSSGSVLPLFYDQLTCGQDVTVTHPQVTRYFMSIQEATTLILNASRFGPGTYVLDMGEPVKIVEMVARMGEMLGIKPRIRFVGLRPGEKLHEELTHTNLQNTAHPLIYEAEGTKVQWLDLLSTITQMKVLCQSYDVGGLRGLLSHAVAGYLPQCGIVDPHWLQKFVYKAGAELDGDDCFLDTKEPENG